MSAYCRVCGNESSIALRGKLLEFDVTYFECSACGYVQTENPHWLSAAYAEPINIFDTGILARNLVNARIVLGTMWLLGKCEGRLVDCAGGYGILVRLLRDFGVDALWSDPYCKNFTARGFEYTKGCADLVTAFEAFEHFENPRAELDRCFSISPNILFSTLIIPDPAPEHEKWWYYGKEHGQHIGFFRIRTLKKLAQQYGKHLLSDGLSFHIMTDRPVNSALWLLSIRKNYLTPLLLHRKWTSKTREDFEVMLSYMK